MVLRFLTLLFCLGWFVYNVWNSFQAFLNNATLVLSSTKHFSELPIPLLLACYSSPYKHFTSVPIYHLQEYYRQAKDPNHLLANRTLWDALGKTELNTMYNGRCVKIHIPATVTDHSGKSLFSQNFCGHFFSFLLKWAGYLAVTGLNLLAQSSDRRSPYGV